MLIFVHHSEDLLDQVRRGCITVNDKVINLLLTCTDLIGEMVEALGNDDVQVKNEKVESIIWEIKKLLKDQTEHTPSEEGSLGDNLHNFGTGERCYRIKLDFNPNLFETGTDPLMLVRELREFSDILMVAVNYTRVPDLYNLDPELCYLTLTILIKTGVGIDRIKDVFIFCSG